MEAKKVAFCCESVYQLFNAIIIRISELDSSCACELIMSDITPWRPELIMNLEKSQLFTKIYQTHNHDIEFAFWDMPLEEKRKVVSDPYLFFGDIGIEMDYDTIFVPIDHIFWKMMYFLEVKKGLCPSVYMYDEGVRAYTMELPKTDDNKPYLKGIVDEYRFIDSIKAYYLHQPDWYSVDKYPYELKKITLMGEKHDVIKRHLLEIYGCDKLPQEEYIYLEDFFYADNYVTNDFKLFETVVSVVGKDNIIVKRHPRDKKDRFSPKGYKTVGNSVIPWEIQLLGNDLSDKTLISVSSTSILTPYMIFESDMHIISLENMFVGKNPTHQDKGYKKFMDTLVKSVNENKIYIHKPFNETELKDTIRYIRLLKLLKRDK